MHWWITIGDANDNSDAQICWHRRNATVWCSRKEQTMTFRSAIFFIFTVTVTTLTIIIINMLQNRACHLNLKCIHHLPGHQWLHCDSCACRLWSDADVGHGSENTYTNEYEYKYLMWIWDMDLRPGDFLIMITTFYKEHDIFGTPRMGENSWDSLFTKMSVDLCRLNVELQSTLRMFTTSLRSPWYLSDNIIIC